MITLAFMGLIAAVALSFQHSLRSQIRLGAERVGGLHAELAAQSGIEYARRQLYDDPLWDGMDASKDPLDMGGGSTFLVTRQSGPRSSLEPTQAVVTVAGGRDGSRVVLEATIDVTPGDPARDKALVSGKDIDIDNVTIRGDVLWTNLSSCRWHFTRVDLDSYDSCDVHEMPEDMAEEELALLGYTLSRDENGDYTISSDGSSLTSVVSPLTATTLELAQENETNWIDPATFDILDMGAWVETQDNAPRSANTSRLDYPGTTYVCAPTDNADLNEEVENDPAHLPGWSLGRYLSPAPCRRLLEDVATLDGLVTDDTVVVVVPAGWDVTVRNCELRGGLVVYAERDFDPLLGYRNRVFLEGMNTIGGASGAGCGENTGLIAPAAEVWAQYGGSQILTGVSFWYSAIHIRMMESTGSTIVQYDFIDVKDSTFIYDEAATAEPPPGVLYYGDLPAVDVVTVQESFAAAPRP